MKKNYILIVIFSIVYIFFMVLVIGFVSEAEEVGIYSTGENVATFTDAQTLDVTEDDIQVDDNLYLSDTYTDKTINDVYSMILSCRNVLIVLLFVEVIRWFDIRFRSIFQRNK